MSQTLGCAVVNALLSIPTSYGHFPHQYPYLHGLLRLDQVRRLLVDNAVLNIKMLNVFQNLLESTTVVSTKFNLMLSCILDDWMRQQNQCCQNIASYASMRFCLLSEQIDAKSY